MDKQIEEIFRVIPELFITEKAKDIDGAYQVIFTDIDSPWHTIIIGKDCKTYPGIHSYPIVTMTVSSDDFIDITCGRLNDTAALMKGKIKIKGNLMKAIKYSKLFRKLS